MSETERNDDGTFAAGEPDTTGLYGREERLVSAGYSVKKDPEPATPDYAGDDPVAEAAAELSAKRGEPEDPITVRDMLGDLDPTEALSVSQAASQLSAARGDIETFYDGMDLAQYVDQIDQRRAAVVDGKPEMARALGLDEVPEAPELTKAKKAEKAETAEIDAATSAEIDSWDGLDPETRKALKIPAVREAIEGELSKAEQVREQYSTSLHQGQQMLQATVTALAPQLQGMPLEHWPQAIQMLGQVDPVRANLVADTLNNWGAIQQAQQQEQQRRAYVAHQQFEATVTSEDARLEQLLGKAGADEANAATISYLSEHGVPRNQMLQVFQANPVLQSAEARQTILEAAKYRALTKSAPRATAKTPPVQRPGTSNAVRASTDSAKMQAVQAQLSTARGDRAVRLAAQLSAMQRKA